MQSYLYGTIVLTNTNQSRNSQTHKITSKPKHISLADTFMSNFCNMGLSSNEKHQLTQENRYEIIHYKKLKFDELSFFVKQLISNILENKSEHINIKASGFGAYVSLTAILNQQLPKNKYYQFQLDGMPINLFPKDFIKSKNSNYNLEISYTINEQCWLNSFTSLTSPPEYLNITDQLIDMRAVKKSMLKAA
jgi:hypothetical protein